jgi:NDP-sugar pyrophosphorylase family protein
VLIGNNCRIGPGCKIGPGAIIGDHCVVEARTTVVRSCVLPDTYLSSDLELNNKIACANAIVSEHCAFADPAQQLCAAFAPLSLGAESRRFA